MAKTYRLLYPQIWGWDNLTATVRRAICQIVTVRRTICQIVTVRRTICQIVLRNSQNLLFGIKVPGTWAVVRPGLSIRSILLSPFQSVPIATFAVLPPYVGRFVKSSYAIAQNLLFGIEVPGTWAVVRPGLRIKSILVSPFQSVPIATFAVLPFLCSLHLACRQSGAARSRQERPARRRSRHHTPAG